MALFFCTLSLGHSLGGRSLPEETEVHAAVGAVLEETGMVGKVVVLAVLQNEQAALAEGFAAKDAVGEFGEFGQGIGRVGKDKVEAQSAALHIFQRIATKRMGCGIAEGAEGLCDEGEMLAVALHGDYFYAAAREEFEGDTARAAKEVERPRFLKVEVGTQDVEQILFGKVRRGTGFETMGHLKMAALIFSCDNTHGERGNWEGMGVRVSVCGGTGGRRRLPLAVENEGHHVIGNAGCGRDDVAIELARWIDAIHLLGILAQHLAHGSLALSSRSADQIDGTLAKVQSLCAGNAQYIIGGILRCMNSKAVAEQQSALLEHRNFQHIFIQVGEDAGNGARHIFRGKVAKHGSLRGNEMSLGEGFLQFRTPQLVQREEQDGIGARQGVEEDAARLFGGEAEVVDILHLFLLKGCHRHERGFSAHNDSRVGRWALQQGFGVARLAQVHRKRCLRTQPEGGELKFGRPMYFVSRQVHAELGKSDVEGQGIFVF